MNQPTFKPTLRKVVLSPEIQGQENAELITSRARDLGLTVETTPREELAEFRTPAAKRVLYLREKAGGFVKEWQPGESFPDRVEWCLTPVEGCNFDCCYCYLQEYLNDLMPVAAINYETLRAEVAAAVHDGATRNFSLGELSDGLFLEPLLNFLPEIWEVFKDATESFLEVRSKSDRGRSLADKLEPLKNVVFSWTLTPQSIVESVELHAAPVERRLTALSRLQQAGFNCGLRLDPVLLVEDWFSQYEKLLARADRLIELADLNFVILGTFRFPVDLDRIILKRFSNATFVKTEFVRGPEGKYRYPRDRRTAAYNKLRKLLQSYGVQPKLCMEPAYVWEDAGFSPPER